MNNDKPEIGLVIPVFLTKYFPNLLEYFTNQKLRRSLRICVVIDGRKEVADFAAQRTWPANVEIIVLPENRGFAGATNAGWKRLAETCPSIKYLGQINDDTIPQEGWLDALADALDRYPRTAMAGPIMETNEGFLGTRRKHALYELGDARTPMRCIAKNIPNDTFVPVVGGFCFLVRRDALDEVGWLDETFKNSCEEVDLCIRLTRHHWRIVSVKNSQVYHLVCRSRGLPFSQTNIKTANEHLQSKWGQDYTQYNRIRPRTAAHGSVFNQDHFIEAWVRNAATYADDIVVAFSRMPYNYNTNARNTVKPDATGDILERLESEIPKLTVVRGEWPYEKEKRNSAVKAARKLGDSLFLIVDIDEFYETREILAALDWMIEHPSPVWFTHHIQMIKQINWSVVSPEGLPRFEFAMDLRKVKGFKWKRGVDYKGGLSIPEEICRCWHFSYLLPPDKLAEKLATFSHANEVRSDWYDQIWPNIKPGMHDFHPVDPKGWKEIVEVEVPEEIRELVKGPLGL